MPRITERPHDLRNPTTYVPPAFGCQATLWQARCVQCSSGKSPKAPRLAEVRRRLSETTGIRRHRTHIGADAARPDHGKYGPMSLTTIVGSEFPVTGEYYSDQSSERRSGQLLVRAEMRDEGIDVGAYCGSAYSLGSPQTATPAAPDEIEQTTRRPVAAR